MLRNPINLKHLCTFGRGVWGTIPFRSVIDEAMQKLINESVKSCDYVSVLWMILTGLAANPLSTGAGRIVANHMGYLLDVSDDLRSLLVVYPPDPILAMAAHKIIDDKSQYGSLLNSFLCKDLQSKFHALDIDRRNSAEVFGGMIILRAIWRSSNVFYDFKSYEEMLKHIEREAPYLKDIWERRIHLLEQENEGQNQFAEEIRELRNREIEIKNILKGII